LPRPHAREVKRIWCKKITLDRFVIEPASQVIAPYAARLTLGHVVIRHLVTACPFWAFPPWTLGRFRAAFFLPLRAFCNLRSRQGKRLPHILTHHHQSSFGETIMRKPALPLAGLLLLSALPAQGEALPEGVGKALVQSSCSGCHGLERIIASRYSERDWETILHMMKNVGAPLPDDALPEVAAYLARNFPEKPAPHGGTSAGPAEISFKEWALPTPGSHPHDPLASLDGTIWYTGQMDNTLGRIEPSSGRITEFHPDTPNSGPHGLVADREGNIWFTANFAGYIGKLDVSTGKVTEYKMPDARARDPHTLLFDQAGMLWFTVQGASMVGRLDPKSGEIKLVSPPTPNASPYGMVITSKGVPYFCEFGANKLASIDPATLAIHEYPLPHAATRPRRIAITPDDIIWYTDYARGNLGRFDPESGRVSEYSSPGGSRSEPYGIAVAKGAVWYSESGVQPNTLVRFDPASEEFQTWAIPAGGGVVRNMMATHDGNIVLAESGVDRVALVEIK
jgi:virginiamycin B lyase